MHNIYPYAIIICKKNLKMETYTRQNNVKKHDNNDKPYRCSYLMHNGGWTYIWKRWMRSIFFRKYECMGLGVNSLSRISYSKKLNYTEAIPFIDILYIESRD